MKDTVIKLHRATRSQNSIGEWVSAIQEVEVFARVQSVSFSEFFNASQIGLAPEFRFLVFHGDYKGEEVLTYEDNNYSVYRVYHNGDDVELYCQREAGTATVTSTVTNTVVQDESQG